jgi:hypothetical protein
MWTQMIGYDNCNQMIGYYDNRYYIGCEFRIPYGDTACLRILCIHEGILMSSRTCTFRTNTCINQGIMSSPDPGTKGRSVQWAKMSPASAIPSRPWTSARQRWEAIVLTETPANCDEIIIGVNLTIQD